jgi:hypothetical protein
MTREQRPRRRSRPLKVCNQKGKAREGCEAYDRAYCLLIVNFNLSKIAPRTRIVIVVDGPIFALFLLVWLLIASILD